MPAGGHSSLSEPESGRWHPAVLDVVEAADELAYRSSVLFYQSLSRTKGTGRPHQDWAVAFGYVGVEPKQGQLGKTAREAGRVVINCMELMARFQKERGLLYSGDHIGDG